MIEEHIERRADITIAAQPVTPEDAPAMGIFRFDAGRPDRRRSRRSRTPARLAADRFERSGGLPVPARRRPTSRSSRRWASTSSRRDVLLEALERHPGVDFGHEIIPAALGTRRVQRVPVPGYWQDVGTVASFYDANIMLTRRRRAVQLLRPAPARLHPARASCPASRLDGCSIDQAVVAEGCYLDQCHDLAVDGRHPHPDRTGLAASALGAAGGRLLREGRRRPVAADGGAGSRASAATACSTGSSWTRTPGSATACGW